MWNFKVTLWNSTQNILPIHWKLWFLYNTEILRAPRFKISYPFLNPPPPPRQIFRDHIYQNDRVRQCLLNSCMYPGIFIEIFAKFILNYIFCQHIVRIFCEIALGWIPIIANQYWYRIWLGALRKQAIIWAIVEQYLCHHMASLWVNEVKDPYTSIHAVLRLGLYCDMQ